MIGAVARDPRAIRQAAHAILSRPEFRQPGPNPLDRLRAWIEDRLAHLLDSALSGRVDLIGLILFVVVASALVWLVVRATRRTRLDRTVGRIRVIRVARTSAAWLEQAAACERAGDWRGALRARYRALVADLATRGVVDETDGRTTGEYRAEVSAAAPAAAGAFGGATELFERAMYGDANVTPDDVERIRDFVGRVTGAQ